MKPPDAQQLEMFCSGDQLRNIVLTQMNILLRMQLMPAMRDNMVLFYGGFVPSHFVFRGKKNEREGRPMLSKLRTGWLPAHFHPTWASLAKRVQQVQHLMRQKASTRLGVRQEDGSQCTLGKSLVVETTSYVSLIYGRHLCLAGFKYYKSKTMPR